MAGWLGYVSLSTGKLHVQKNSELLPEADSAIFTPITPVRFPATFLVQCSFATSDVLSVRRTIDGATVDIVEKLNGGVALTADCTYTFSIIAGEDEEISLSYGGASSELINSLYVIESGSGLV
jgi:hypothetical protein